MNKSISKLHYISQQFSDKSHLQLIEEACAAGIDWVQLRVKNCGYDEWLSTAKAAREICDRFNSTLIINDSPEIAKLCKADGVHLGKDDKSPWEARKILGNKAIIGGTANTEEDIEKLVFLGVDYVGLGPYRLTETKEKLSPVLGIEKIKEMLSKKYEIPVIIIGGIIPEDVEIIYKTGAYGIAVSSAINKAENKAGVIKRFKDCLLHENYELL
jgi:thiamine-phosphate pyrophosphorylase